MKAMLNRSVFAACNLAQTLVTEKKKRKKNPVYSTQRDLKQLLTYFTSNKINMEDILIQFVLKKGMSCTNLVCTK